MKPVLPYITRDGGNPDPSHIMANFDAVRESLAKIGGLRFYRFNAPWSVAPQANTDPADARKLLLKPPWPMQVRGAVLTTDVAGMAVSGYTDGQFVHLDTDEELTLELTATAPWTMANGVLDLVCRTDRHHAGLPSFDDPAQPLTTGSAAAINAALTAADTACDAEVAAQTAPHFEVYELGDSGAYVNVKTSIPACGRTLVRVSLYSDANALQTITARVVGPPADRTVSLLGPGHASADFSDAHADDPATPGSNWTVEVEDGGGSGGWGFARVVLYWE